MQKPQQSAARVLATRLATVLTKYLAGQVDPVGVATELRKIADWVDSGKNRKEVKGKTTPKREEHMGSVTTLFAYWVKATGRDPKTTKFTEGRKTKLLARLADGYTERDIKHAIDVVASSPFHQGQNDRSHRYDDLMLICRTGEQLEKYRDMKPRSLAERDDTQQEDERTILRREASEALKRGDLDAYNEINAQLAGRTGR